MLIDHRFCQITTRPGFISGTGRGALFLDRDGLLIDDPGYLRNPADVRLRSGAADLVAYANRLEVPVIIVTNQSGIGRSFLTWSDFALVNAALARLLAFEGAVVDAVMACSWHPQIDADCATGWFWRKPQPGMLLAAAAQFGVKLADSWFAGDRFSDIRAARRAALCGAFLVNPRIRHVRQVARRSFAMTSAPDLPSIREPLRTALRGVAARREHCR